MYSVAHLSMPSRSRISYVRTCHLIAAPRYLSKGDGVLLGQKVPGGPTPMYGHGLNLNEQWVSMLEKVGGVFTWLRCIVSATLTLPFIRTTFCGT